MCDVCNRQLRRGTYRHSAHLRYVLAGPQACFVRVAPLLDRFQVLEGGVAGGRFECSDWCLGCKPQGQHDTDCLKLTDSGYGMLSAIRNAQRLGGVYS